MRFNLTVLGESTDRFSCLNLGQVKRQTQQSDTTAFLEGVGDLVTGLITTGLRSVAALITSGNEATQKMAVVISYIIYSGNSVLQGFHILLGCWISGSSASLEC